MVNTYAHPSFNLTMLPAKPKVEAAATWHKEHSPKDVEYINMPRLYESAKQENTVRERIYLSTSHVWQ